MIVNEDSQRIEYLSPTVEDKKYDKKLAEESQLTLPPTATVVKDKEFEGYEVPGGEPATTSHKRSPEEASYLLYRRPLIRLFQGSGGSLNM